MHVDRDRVLRLLTFWLRPDFILRCVRRFTVIAGFDRAIALASLSFTALVPLLMFTGSVLPHTGSSDTGERLVKRFDLGGEAAKAVHQAFSSGANVEAGLGVFATLLIIIAVLSFTRAFQRLLEQTWELPPLSVRNTKNGLLWIGTLIVYFAVETGLHALLPRGVAGLLASVVAITPLAAFLVWTGWVLTARRLTWQHFVPGALTGTAGSALFAIGSAIYVPHLFNSYATRFGAIGVSFALVSWLFGLMVLQVAATCIGREVWDELRAIERGEEPSNEQIEKEWDEVRAQVRMARAEARRRYAEVRRRLRRDGG